MSNPAEIRLSYGGAARNIAETLARLGQEVDLISVIGDDTVGRQLIEFTSRAGVNMQACKVIPKSQHSHLPGHFRQ